MLKAKDAVKKRRMLLKKEEVFATEKHDAEVSNERESGSLERAKNAEEAVGV